MAAIALQTSEEKPVAVESQSKSITLRISKFNPKTESNRNFVDFTIPYKKWTTVLDAILAVKENFDHSVGVRYSCRQSSCGSCGMKINGKPALACYTKISELNSNTITVEPMDNFPIIRDLVVSFERMFSAHKKLKPYIISEDSEITKDTKEFLQTPEDVEKYLQFSNCIKCGLCNSACPTMATDSSFIGPQALAQAYRYVADNRDKGKNDRLKIIDDSHGIWRCHFAGSCSKVCPKGVDPAMAIQLLRGYLLGFRK
ncbi:MAG: anaerobic fumarate reductase, Fe-S subunit [Marine Group I thaumarchaeote]|nr:MAG: anaerobic fumarate reductase, Fe-S subunit [Marine Group I thaumarchaeote]